MENLNQHGSPEELFEFMLRRPLEKVPDRAPLQLHTNSFLPKDLHALTHAQNHAHTNAHTHTSVHLVLR